MARLLAILGVMSQNTGSDNAIFFTVIGSQDPQVSPGEQQGPALDLLDALLSEGHQIDEVLLVWTPGATNRNWPGGYDDQKDRFVTAVRERLPQVKVKAVEMRARPNSAAEVLPVLAGALARFRQGRRLHVNTSSGTPQMLEALKVLRGTGWFAGGGVTLWQIDRPEYRVAGEAHWREARTPFLEEALRLESAFGALERFDFAGAEDAFNELAQAPLELPGRNASVQALADIAHALWLLDARDFAKAADVMRQLGLHVPPLAPLRELVEQGAGHDSDALIWLTWGRYDRARSQAKVADALIWAVILHELMVVKLMEQHGISPDQKKRFRASDLSSGLFEQLRGEVPELFQGNEIKLLGAKEWLIFLQAPSVMGEKAQVFNTNFNPRLDKVRRERNDVIHQGVTPEMASLDQADDVVSELLMAFPFETGWAQAWAKAPDNAPISAQALTQLALELRGWVG